MAFYVVSFELRRVREYKTLQDYLALWGAIPLHRTAFLVEHPGTAVNVRKDLQPFMDEGDTVVAIQIKPGAEWSGWQVPKPGSDWLGKHFPKSF
jgi:hypothetical protein